MEQTLTESYVIGRPMTGEQVGNYLLLHELGRGGYAQVYLAEHLSLKHLVALKLLNLSLNQHEDLVRFQFEARLLAQLQHRHIVRALNFDWEGDRLSWRWTMLQEDPSSRYFSKVHPSRC